MKAVLILGASVMQGPAIHIAKQKGYKVYVADANAKARHAEDADCFLPIDLKDKEALLEAAMGIEGLFGVFTAGTDFSASVAYIANKLNLPGIPYEAAVRASNKADMRTCLQAAGVPAPSFFVVHDTVSLDKLTASFRSRLRPSELVFPLVVKPVDNMGARGCRAVFTMEELKAGVEDALRFSRSGQAIVEEYIEGPEFSIDALVHDGRLVVRGVADRHISFMPYFVELGHTMPTIYPKDVVDEVVAVFTRGVQALGITHGAAKGDMKFSRAGASVGEIAARLSGGYMSGWTYPAASGISVTAEALDLACGIRPDLQQEQYSRVSAERAFISIPGRVKEVYTEGVECDHLFLRIQAGDTVVFPSNNVEKCGNVIVTRDKREAAEQAADKAAAGVIIRLEPDNKDTEAYLSAPVQQAGGYEWPPEAFNPVDAMVLAMIESMPDLLRSEPGARTIGIAPVYTIKDQKALDWNGRSLTESLEIITRHTGAVVTKDADLVLGKVFWKALIRGGYQAGMYVIDTYMEKFRQ